MTLRLTAALVPFVALAPPAFALDASSSPWTGQMQCGVTWKDSGDEGRTWMLSVTGDTSDMKLAISDRVRRGDPAPSAKDEVRELAPRKAMLKVAGIGGSTVEVTSYPTGDGRMWHDMTLGHVEALDTFPTLPVLTLTIGDSAPMMIEMRDFDGARAYLKRCIVP